jgi:hypothetical protein
MDVCLLCLYAVLSYVCTGIGCELIPRPKESYMSNKDSETQKEHQKTSIDVTREKNQRFMSALHFMGLYLFRARDGNNVLLVRWVEN